MHVLTARRLACVAALALTAVPASAKRLEKVYGLASGTGKAVEVAGGEVLVRFAPGASRASVAAAVGGALTEQAGSEWQVVQLPEGMTTAQGLAALKAVPGVAAVEYNRFYRPNLIPNDPYVNGQYALSQINAFEGWDHSTGGSSVIIAVIDAGVHATHSEFTGRMVAGRECVDATCAADAVAFACNHGTRVAGVAAAAGNNGAGIAGLNWGARIHSVRVFHENDCNDDCSDQVGAPNGGCGTFDSWIAAAINDAVGTIGASEGVINMSLGGPPAACNGALQAAINNAVASGIPVFVSAGNDGGAVNSPANCANTIPVAATDASGNIASFSSRGAELDARGVAAPGVTVLTTDINQSTASATGTSFAAPYAAALGALLLTVQPGWTADQVREALRRSANNIGLGAYVPQGTRYGAGRINAFLALQLAVKGQLADFGGEDKVVAFPNPFRPSRNRNVFFAIAPSLQADGATLKVYTVSGQLVRELAGLSWDGRNSDGQPVATGTYVFVLSNDKGVHRGRLAVIR